MDNTKIKEAKDLLWCLINESDELNIKKQILDSKKSDKPFVKITHKPNDCKLITKIKIYAPNSKEKLLKSLEIKNIQGTTSNVTNKNNRTQLTINFDEDGSKSSSEKYLSKIFSTLLITGRPLRYYNCTFFLPLDLILDTEIRMDSNSANLKIKENEDIEQYKVRQPSSLLNLNKEEQTEDEIAHSQAYEYFHTHMQEQLFEIRDNIKTPNTIPIKHHRIKNDIVKDLSLVLIDDDCVTKAQIEDVSLYEYYNGMYILGVRVGLPMNNKHHKINDIFWADEENKKQIKSDNPHVYDLICNDKIWWKSLVFGSEESWKEIRSLQVEHWLRYTKLIRVLYANFHEQYEEKKIAEVELRRKDKLLKQNNVKDPFSCVMRYFIQEFLEIKTTDLQRDQRLKQLADERMFVQTSYVLAGTPPKPDTTAQHELERLFSYALYVDQQTDGYSSADGWAYDKGYIKKTMQSHIIRRWQSISSLSGFTDYSTVFMGFGAFFQNPTSTVHIPYIYAKIQVQAIFYRLTLEHFDRRIAVATEKLMVDKVKSKEFSHLRRSLINFINGYWFRELTPQIQGAEISNLIMKQQGLNEKYNLIKDKLEKANEYSIAIQGDWMQDKAAKVGWIAVILAILAMIPGLFDTCIASTPSIKYLLIGMAIFAPILIISYPWILKKIKTMCETEEKKDECIRK